jgi:hypothetical protein
VVTARVPVRVAERLRQLVRARDCSVARVIADGIAALESQAASHPKATALPAGKVAP